MLSIEGQSKESRRRAMPIQPMGGRCALQHVPKIAIRAAPCQRALREAGAATVRSKTRRASLQSRPRERSLTRRRLGKRHGEMTNSG